jgi:tRNA (guanine37-N1)-methyltransferase
MAYRIDIMTLFPDSMGAMLGESILGRAAKKGAIRINCVQIRDTRKTNRCRWTIIHTAAAGASL